MESHIQSALDHAVLVSTEATIASATSVKLHQIQERVQSTALKIMDNFQKIPLPKRWCKLEIQRSCEGKRLG
jgi:hypothetical protein